MEKHIKNQSQLEYVLCNLPDKSPPRDLQSHIMSALPNRKESWFSRIKHLFSVSPNMYRTVGAMASLILAFYGGTQVDRLFKEGVENPKAQIAVQENMSDEAYYYLGRSLLAAGQAEEALRAFSNAEFLRPDTPQYTLWKGAAYQVLGSADKERQSYEQLILSRPELLSPRLRLANNLLKDGRGAEAEQLYSQILERNPTEKTALYNRALSLRMQEKSFVEAQAWKEYLHFYRTGPSAHRALQHLQELGDYSFRVYQLGHKSVILNQKRLLDPADPGIGREINYLARQFENRSLSGLSIVVFVEDDLEQAQDIANSLRMALSDQAEGKEKAAVRISWFDEAEPLKTVNDEKIYLSKGVLIFSALKNNTNDREQV